MTSTTKVLVVAPPGGGFAPWKWPVLAGLVCLWTFYFVVYAVVDVLLPWTAAPAFCDAHGSSVPACNRPDLIAFQLTATIMMYYMGLHGLYGWHWWRPRHADTLLATPQARVLGKLSHAETLCAGILVYQTWDFMASCVIPEHQSVEFLIHHLLTGLTAYLSLEFQMMHHYAVYFGGCSEISTMTLVWVDLDRYFPATGQHAPWATFILVNQVFFVITFIAYRIIGWPIYSVSLWRDVVGGVLPQPTLPQLRPGKVWFLYVFLFMSVALGALQMYWFATGLLPKIMEFATASSE